MCPQEVDKKAEEKTPFSEELYQPVGNVDITLWGRCHYDDTAKLFLAKAQVGDRFAVVGWAVKGSDGQMIQEVRIRPTVPPPPKREENEERKAFIRKKKQYNEKIELLQARYGKDNLIFAQEPMLAQGGSGVVHESVIKDVTKSELKSAQVISGLSFTVEKDYSRLDANKLVWLNRSTKNQSFKLTSMARLCYMFQNSLNIITRPPKYTGEVNLERSIPKKQFYAMLEASSKILGMKCECNEKVFNLLCQRKFTKIMQLKEDDRKKEITKRFNTNLYIAAVSVPVQMTSAISTNYQSNGLLDNMTRLMADAKKNNVELDMNFIPEGIEGTDAGPALLLAVKKGYTKIVERLCSINMTLEEKNRFNVTSQNKEGNNILHNACLCEVEDKKDPSVNVQNNLLNQLFKLEDMKGNIDVVNAKNKKGETPLHIAMKRANIDVIKTLIYRKADLEIRDKFGWTPRMIALCYDKTFQSLSLTEDKEESPNISILKSILLEYNMAKDPKDYDQLILKACEKKDIKVISALINIGFSRDEILYNLLNNIADQGDAKSVEDYAQVFKELQSKDDKETVNRLLSLAGLRDDDRIIDVLDKIQKIEKNNVLSVLEKVLKKKDEPETDIFIKKVMKKFGHEMKPNEILTLVKLAAKKGKYHLIKILEKDQVNPVLLSTAAIIAIGSNNNKFFKYLVSDFSDEMKKLQKKEIQKYADAAAMTDNYDAIEVLKEKNLMKDLDLSRLASIAIEKGKLDFCKKILDNFKDKIHEEKYGELNQQLFDAQYKKSKSSLLSGIIASPDSSQSNIIETKPLEQKPDNKRKPT